MKNVVVKPSPFAYVKSKRVLMVPSGPLVMCSDVSGFMSALLGPVVVGTTSITKAGRAPSSWSCYGLEASGSFTIAPVVFFIHGLRTFASAISSAAAVIKARLISSLTLAAAHS